VAYLEENMKSRSYRKTSNHLFSYYKNYLFKEQVLVKESVGISFNPS